MLKGSVGARKATYRIMLRRSRLLGMAAILLGLSARARAQDSAPGGEPITSVDPATLTYDYLVDGTLAMDDPAAREFGTLQAALDAAPAGTADRPTVIGIAPNVYLLPGGTTGPSLN